MVILDTNIWVAALNQNDSLHSKAQKLFSNLNEEILIPEYILVETLNILSVKAGKRQTEAFLKTALNSEQVEILFSSKLFFQEISEFFVNFSYNKLSFVDQSLLFLSQKYPVLTFDKDLARHL